MLNVKYIFMDYINVQDRADNIKNVTLRQV